MKNGELFGPSTRNPATVVTFATRGTPVVKGDAVCVFAEDFDKELFCDALYVDGGTKRNSFRITCARNGNERLGLEGAAPGNVRRPSGSKFVSGNTASALAGCHLVYAQGKSGTLYFVRSGSELITSLSSSDSSSDSDDDRAPRTATSDIVGTDCATPNTAGSD